MCLCAFVRGPKTRDIGPFLASFSPFFGELFQNNFKLILDSAPCNICLMLKRTFLTDHIFRMSTSGVKTIADWEPPKITVFGTLVPVCTVSVNTYSKSFFDYNYRNKALKVGYYTSMWILYIRSTDSILLTFDMDHIRKVRGNRDNWSSKECFNWIWIWPQIPRISNERVVSACSRWYYIGYYIRVGYYIRPLYRILYKGLI